MEISRSTLKVLPWQFPHSLSSTHVTRYQFFVSKSIVRTKGDIGLPGKLCPLWQCLRRSTSWVTCRGDKISVVKYWHTLGDVSLQHVPATFSSLFIVFWICLWHTRLCYTSFLHNPGVYTKWFLSLRHAPSLSMLLTGAPSKMQTKITLYYWRHFDCNCRNQFIYLFFTPNQDSFIMVTVSVRGRQIKGFWS